MMKIWMLWSVVLGLVLASVSVVGEGPETNERDFYLRLVGGPVVETGSGLVTEPILGLYALLLGQNQTSVRRQRERSRDALGGPDKNRRQSPPSHELSLGGYGQCRQSQTYGQFGR